MNAPPSNITAPEHWSEWFEKCALARCCDETRLALGKFAYLRYERYLLVALGAGKAKSDLPIEARDLLDLSSPSSCWYDLEDSYWGRPIPKDGSKHGDAIKAAKVYKKFHLEVSSQKATPEDARDYLEAKTSSNLIKSRCRSIISKARIFSLDSRGEQVPDESQDQSAVEVSMHSSNGIDIIRGIFDDLTTEERILILAKANNISLAHPEICSRLGLSKSVLYQRQKAATNSIAPRLLRDNFAAEDVSLVLSHLLNFLTQWALSPECGIGDCLMCGEANT
jgi:hypothetical protein